MQRYSIELRTKKYVIENEFLSFARIYKKQLLYIRLDSLKAASKKEIHKAGEFLGNKVADTVTKSSCDKIVKQEPVVEIIIPPE